MQRTELDFVRSFTKGDGPFVRGLDTALKSFNVERQAYYSGTFVGNHVHHTLKVTRNYRVHLLTIDHSPICVSHLGGKYWHPLQLNSSSSSAALSKPHPPGTGHFFPNTVKHSQVSPNVIHCMTRSF